MARKSLEDELDVVSSVRRHRFFILALQQLMPLKELDKLTEQSLFKTVKDDIIDAVVEDHDSAVEDHNSESDSKLEASSVRQELHREPSDLVLIDFAGTKDDPSERGDSDQKQFEQVEQKG